jgi:hypothetical protein
VSEAVVAFANQLRIQPPAAEPVSAALRAPVPEGSPPAPAPAIPQVALPVLAGYGQQRQTPAMAAVLSRWVPSVPAVPRQVWWAVAIYLAVALVLLASGSRDPRAAASIFVDDVVTDSYPAAWTRSARQSPRTVPSPWVTIG